MNFMLTTASGRFNERGDFYMMDENEALEARLALALREIRTLNADLLHAWDEIDGLREQLENAKEVNVDGKNDK